MSRRVGWYSAKFEKDTSPEIVFYNGFHCERTHGFNNRMPEEFYWISDKCIVPEEPPVKMVVNSWYLFTIKNGATMVGQYKPLGDGRYYIWASEGMWWYVDMITILGGPFTTEELSQRK